MALSLALLMTLPGCTRSNAPIQIEHPKPPEKPYHAKAVALYIAQQSETIDQCRAALGQ